MTHVDIGFFSHICLPYEEIFWDPYLRTVLREKDMWYIWYVILSMDNAFLDSRRLELFIPDIKDVCKHCFVGTTPSLNCVFHEHRLEHDLFIDLSDLPFTTCNGSFDVFRNSLNKLFFLILVPFLLNDGWSSF